MNQSAGAKALQDLIDYCPQIVLRHMSLGALAALQADAQALADVRTLDDWSAERSHYQWCLERDRNTWRVKVQHSGGTQLLDVGATPDEARAKAAAWVREQGK